MAYTTIDKPSDYFNTVLYTGNGNQRNITGVGFQPDWIWGKNRSATGSHNVIDSVRGVSKIIYTNLNDAEATDTSSFNAFGSDGFSVGSQSNVNGNGNSIVAWNWKAGTSFTNDASATGIGSIDSAGSFNNDAGFSIVSYTGNATDNASVKHGLNTAPKMVIIKDLSDTSTWGVWHQSLTNGGYKLTLNSTAAQADDSAFIGGSNRAIPTSSVFFLGSGGGGNGTNANIAYCFSEVEGYSKFGSYTGNGNADGTFVYTGFKPAFVIRKVTSASSDWLMQDNKRSESGGFNQIRNYLFPNSSQAEVSNQDYFNIDFLSNGFKMRSTDGGANGSGSSYIYMAFAENPFVTSSGVPACAR